MSRTIGVAASVTNLPSDTSRVSRLENLTWWKRTLITSLLVLVLSLVLIILTETFVRVRHYVVFGDFKRVEDTFEVDPSLDLRVPKPGWNDGRIRINALGFRSPEIDATKPPGVIRLAFLGGSTTYCAEVSGNKATWPARVSYKLSNEHQAGMTEYINAAVPGFGITESLSNLKHRVEPFKPDVVVIYHATNDLARRTHTQAITSGLIRENENSVGPYWISRYSMLAYLAEKNLRLLFTRRRAEQIVNKLQPDLKRASLEFRADLEQLVRAAAAHSRLVVLITFSTKIRPGQSPEKSKNAATTSLYYMPYMTVPALLDGYNAFNEVIREVARANGTILVEAAHGIPADAEHFADSFHLTDAGSEVMAQLVSRSISTSAQFRKIVSAPITKLKSTTTPVGAGVNTL